MFARFTFSFLSALGSTSFAINCEGMAIIGAIARANFTHIG